MHAIFAIEPKALDCWAEFRYVIEKFGFHKGLLIAQYPKTWSRMVIEACEENGIRDVERQRVVETLVKIKHDRLFRMGLQYSDLSWIDNTLNNDNVNFFDSVISKHRNAHEKVHSVSDLSEALFENRRECSVCRTAGALAKAGKFLLRGVPSITLIDPYFQPKSRNIKVLSEMIGMVDSAQSIVIEIHAAHSKYAVNEQVLISEYQNLLEAERERISSLVIYRWHDQNLEFDFHARYLITDRGGLRFDRGFVEPADHQQREHKTDVICMEPVRVNELREQYSHEEGLIDKVQII